MSIDRQASSDLPNRRDALQKAALLGAGVLGTGGFSPLISRTGAIEPIARQSGPKFKFSLAAYGYRKLLSGDPAELTLDDFISDCAKMVLDVNGEFLTPPAI